MTAERRTSGGLVGLTPHLCGCGEIFHEEPMRDHRYTVSVEWTGNRGEGTASYRTYSRDHRVVAGDKPPVLASADPHFRGDPARYNPEELLVASLSGCHMLWYLHVCADAGVTVVSYSDNAEGRMSVRREGGSFIEVVLRPQVVITDEAKLALAEALHDRAAKACFIASSVSFPVRHEPQVRVGQPEGSDAVVNLRRAEPEEWRRVRDLRLRALRDTPDAFTATVEEESGLSAEEWRQRVDRPDRVTVLASVAGADVALAVAWPHHDRDGAAGLYSVWVAPEARGLRVGEALLAEVIAWARAGGYSRLLLDVGDWNAAAIRLYERMGFKPTGRTATMPPPRAHVTEHERALDL